MHVRDELLTQRLGQMICAELLLALGEVTLIAAALPALHLGRIDPARTRGAVNS